MDVGEYIRNKEKSREQKGDNMQKYMSMSEEQLMQELFRTANSSDVKNEELDDFYKKASPFLTPEQKEKMKNLILQLKR